VCENKAFLNINKTIFSTLKIKVLNVLVTFLWILLSLNSDAQRKDSPCGTRLRPEEIPMHRARVMPGHGDCTTINKVDKTFQISLWICLDSLGSQGIAQGDIDGTLERLNRDFLPAGMQFQICQTQLMENFKWDSLTVFETYNEELQMRALHYEPNTINVYLVSLIGRDDINPSGYAYFPGGPDVIVCRKDAFNEDATTMPHEMGHFFGLYHTFETEFGVELIDESNCETTGDLVCDTRPDPDEDGNADPDDQCNYTGTITQDPNGDWYLPPTDNLMSYYPVECRCRFTPQQYNRMIEQYLTLRNYLW
jgi:hypothetical protein